MLSNFSSDLSQAFVLPSSLSIFLEAYFQMSNDNYLYVLSEVTICWKQNPVFLFVCIHLLKASFLGWYFFKTPKTLDIKRKLGKSVLYRGI